MQTTDTIQNSTVQPSSHAARGLGVVLAGGLIAGALDLTFAFVFYGQQGAAPLRILQGIASGVLGRGSLQMGLASAALGAFFHFFISVCAAAIYYLASLRFSFLTRWVAISGAIFGVLMFLAMHFIVVPLSAIKPSPMKVGNVIGELCSHVFLFGMVIAYAVSRVKSLRTGA
jgi:uncharacterized membrane protein YagU involved in acid resistance